MTRSQIEYILALAKLESFGKAAKACFVTQSTLSAMVAKVEEQIGITLFNRKTRPVSLTPQGERVVKVLKSIYREYQVFDEVVNEIKGYDVGDLSIACIPTVAPYLYPLILNEMSRKHSEINFTIHELTTENIIEEIIAGDIDVGIVSIPLEHEELKEYDLYVEDFLLYDCGNTSKSSKFKVSDIDLERLWLMEEGHCMRNQVGKICELRQLKKINGNLTYNCGSIFTLIEMVKMNKGVTLLPRLALANNTQIQEHNIYNILAPVPSRKIGIVTHKNYVKKGMLSDLIQIIKDAVEGFLPKNTSEQAIFKPLR